MSCLTVRKLERLIILFLFYHVLAEKKKTMQL